VRGASLTSCYALKYFTAVEDEADVQATACLLYLAIVAGQEPGAVFAALSLTNVQDIVKCAMSYSLGVVYSPYQTLVPKEVDCHSVILIILSDMRF
jgi:hypothetical protein